MLIAAKTDTKALKSISFTPQTKGQERQEHYALKGVGFTLLRS